MSVSNVAFRDEHGGIDGRLAIASVEGLEEDAEVEANAWLGSSLEGRGGGMTR